MTFRLVMTVLAILVLGAIAAAKGMIGNSAPSFSSETQQMSVPSDTQQTAPAPSSNPDDTFKNLKL